MLKTKSVWTPIDRENDGLRILATRFRGRGMRTSRYDVWMRQGRPPRHVSSPTGPVTRRSAMCTRSGHDTSQSGGHRITVEL
jgi:hypothetical protein